MPRSAKKCATAREPSVGRRARHAARNIVLYRCIIGLMDICGELNRANIVLYWLTDCNAVRQPAESSTWNLNR